LGVGERGAADQSQNVVAQQQPLADAEPVAYPPKRQPLARFGALPVADVKGGGIVIARRQRGAHRRVHAPAEQDHSPAPGDRQRHWDDSKAWMARAAVGLPQEQYRAPCAQCDVVFGSRQCPLSFWPLLSSARIDGHVPIAKGQAPDSLGTRYFKL